MSNNVSEFLSLQAIDQEILRFESELKKKGDHIAEDKVAYRKLDAELTNTKEILVKAKAERDLKQVDLVAINEKKDKLNERLQNIKNNKEYKALEKEARNYKEESEYLTRYIDASDENIKKLEASLSKGEATLVDLKQKIKGLIIEHNESQHVLHAKIDELKAKRSNQTSRINTIEKELPEDQKFLSRYEKLTRLPARDCLAVMIDETCQGCYMRVNTQLASKIKSLRRMEICTSCHRILYVD